MSLSAEQEAKLAQWTRDMHPNPNMVGPGYAAAVSRAIVASHTQSRELGAIPDPQESFIDFAPTFLAVEDPPMEQIFPGLIQKGVIINAHGDPRTMKTLAAEEMVIAAATMTAPFGMTRHHPLQPYRCLYTTQEDAAATVRRRFKGLLRGRDIQEFPDNLGFAVHKGVDLDSGEWRARFYDEVMRHRFEYVVIDPIRGFTANSEKNSSDVVPVTKFFRQLAAEGVTVHLIHHDVKPPSSGPDMRRRSHRASGGPWFSISECPISFEKISDGVSLVSPEDYKLTTDPAPFTITYRESNGAIQLIGENTTSGEAVTLAIDEAVLTYLSGQPGASGRSITKALRKGAGAVGESLERLFAAGKLDCAEGPKRAKLWTIRR